MTSYKRITGKTINNDVYNHNTMSNIMLPISRRQPMPSNIIGDVTGDISGNVEGNVTGHVTGDISGNVEGNLVGHVTGHVTGDISGNIDGDYGTFKNIFIKDTGVYSGGSTAISNDDNTIDLSYNSISGFFNVNDDTLSGAGEFITITMDNSMITPTSCIIVNTNNTDYHATGFNTSIGQATIQVKRITNTPPNRLFKLHFVIIHF